MCALLARIRLERIGASLVVRPAIGMAVLAALPVVLRLALLPVHPVPVAPGGDDFSYLLLGDTLSHFRFANPAHPMHRFFEGVFILQQPTYSSVYPMGQGIALAAGELLFRNPWAGVLLSIGALCSLCYWMLRGWVTPGWALIGGILAALEFGPLSTWMNDYWGGAVSAIAGCLVFGALPRIKRNRKTRDAILLGTGLGIQMLSRPYEFVLLLAAVLLFFLPRRSLLIAAVALLPAAALTLVQNKAVTGHWSTLPYVLSRYQYGVPTTFTFQPVPKPHQALTAEQQVDYDYQSETHGRGTYFSRFVERAGFYGFFFFPPLYLALPFFLPCLRRYRYIWVALSIAIFWIGTTFYPFFYPHYIAAETCLFVLISVKGVEQLSRWRPEASQFILLLCLAHFLFWYGNAYTLNPGDPERRTAINDRLDAAPGKQLVFVRFSPRHGPSDWIHNAADIDASKIVWAIDLGADEDEKLRHYYPGRHTWLLEADARPPNLSPYPQGSKP